jgi:hypothetical protein
MGKGEMCRGIGQRREGEKERTGGERMRVAVKKG